MDSLEAWRNAIERVLSDHAAIPYHRSEVRSEVVFDRKHDRYLIVDVGWERGDRIHGTLVYVDILDRRIWIQYDGTERGVAHELVAVGVPSDKIVLGFRDPELRKYTGFAAA